MLINKSSLDRWSSGLRSLLDIPRHRTRGVVLADTDFEVTRTPRYLHLDRREFRFTLNVPSGHARLSITREGCWEGGGIQGLLVEWIPILSRIVGAGLHIEVATAQQHGWSVDHVEACQDWTNVHFSVEDAVAERWTGRHGARSPRYDGGSLYVGPAKRGPESIQVVVQPKSEIIRRKDGIEPQDSIYGATWRAHGWDGATPVTRVEVRGGHKKLKLKDEATGDVIDLRDPAKLCDPVALATFYFKGIRHRRLVVPNRRRTRQNPTDQRWEPVLTAAAQATGGEAPRLTFIDTTVPLTHRQRRQRAERALVRAAAELAILVGADDPATVTMALDPLLALLAVQHRDVNDALVRARARLGDINVHGHFGHQSGHFAALPICGP